MFYYFEVVLHNDPNHILVRARDVIEAGQKVAMMLQEQGYFVCEEQIVEITRTNIKTIINN